MSVNNSSFHIGRFARRASDSVDAGSRVLDAGAGDSPYRKFFEHCDYEATDLGERPQREYAGITFQCDLSDIPVEDSRYDLILCTQVLEHVPEPQLVLKELFRVLKPGGKLWLSAPLYYPEHEQPFDYFRYTQFGMRHLFTAAGFEVQDIDWVGGYLGTLSIQLGQAWHALPIRPRELGGGLVGTLAAVLIVFLKPIIAVLALTFAKLDRHIRLTERGHCVDYSVIAERPSVQKKVRQPHSD